MKPPEKYDPFRRIPETPCGCGKCGLTFRKTIGQRTRKWAPGCPNRPPIHGYKVLRSAKR